MYSTRIERFFAAPPHIVWAVITDIEQNGHNAPNLLYQRPQFDDEGQIVGVVCANNQGQEWYEDMLIWEPMQRYKTAVDTSNYPYPFKSISATNSIHESNSGTRLVITVDFEPDVSLPFRWLLAQYAKFMLASIFRKMMDKWEVQVMHMQQSHQQA